MGNGNRHYLNTIKKYVPEEKWKIFICEIEKLVNDIEEESFVEGYCYAIKVLQDGLKKKPI